ncbi:hypothetical protein PFICI_12419 [Pestalotiopsis fici W106-1]|uniref:Ketoreductase domain-containing protein n=1 Tax=Pestalotiopsis fici (strain W106-1 / CGMCC3.15140) TaxID=1229662 RepID=W3WNI8_PESFW|nr:uncharacterized protein PFICI_12419 [Pestalotiopsis fici W106-1]ETS75475.1 hypothetical protein PFICI_12419 [Pestalotiopsis fici W106-1]
MNPVNTKPYKIPSDAIWFITGSSQGIGRNLAELVAQNPSSRLIATARNTADLSYLPDSNPNVLKIKLDVSSTSSVQETFDTAAAHWGGPEKKLRVDVVINNAGYSLSGDTENATDQQIQRHMETVFHGTARITMQAVKSMREGSADGRGGLIINISSTAGLRALPGTAYYHASKYAVEGFTESVAREMHPDWNISFCLIEPGMVKTNFESTSKDKIPPHPGYQAPGTPRVALAEYVAENVSAGSGASADLVVQTILNVAYASFVEELDNLREQSLMGGTPRNF